MLKLITFFIICGSTAFIIRNHFLGRRCRCKKNLSSKIIIITGATTGIGLAVAKILASKGATLILASRNILRLESITKDLKKKSKNENISAEHLDQNSFDSIRIFCEKINKSGREIYALVNNAGVFYAAPQNTENKFDVTFQTNYLGPYLLTLNILPSLRRSKESRIVNLSSQAHLVPYRFPQPEFHREFSDNPQNRFAAYQYSKFCLVLFSYKLSSILQSTSTTVQCVDPGNTETSIFRHFPQLSNKFLFFLQKPIRIFIIKTPFEGAQGVIHALQTENPPFYIKDLSESKDINIHVYNPTFSSTLWTISRKYCENHLISDK